jgi:alkylresorcinol/alkylpyrone synthase
LQHGREVARIVSTATAVPPFVLRREQLKRLCCAVYPERAQAILRLIDNTRIDKRHLTRPIDAIMAPRSLSEKSIDFERMSFDLSRAVGRRALERAQRRPDEIDLLITTSCTGVMIPSVDAYLVEELQLRRDVVRLPITALGCAGGASALARARDHLVAYPEHVVLVIAIELPSLTFDIAELSMTALVAATLFGDGAAAVVLASRGRRPSPRLIDSQTHVYENSQSLMGFKLRDRGFRIVLEREVPARLRGQVSPLVDRLLRKHGISLDQIQFAAIHPGGRRLLEELEHDLGLDEKVLSSWSVLRKYGNLSSATILFVLDDLLDRPAPQEGSYGLLCAFGPGFSCELSLMQWES